MVKLNFLEAGHTEQLEALALRGGRWAKIKFPATVTVLQHPTKGVALFDTGYGLGFHAATKYLPEKLYALTTPVFITPETTAAAQLARLGIQTRDVQTVVLSHLHGDHVGGVSDFAHARYVLDGAGYRYYSQMGRFEAVRHAFLSALLPGDFEQRAQFLMPTDYQQHACGLQGLGSGFDLFGDQSAVIVPLPGHARGHLGMLVESPDGPVLLISDAAYLGQSIEENRPAAAAVRLITDDYPQYLQTLKTLHDLHAMHRPLQIVACHCEKTLESQRQPNAR